MSGKIKIFMGNSLSAKEAFSEFVVAQTAEGYTEKKACYRGIKQWRRKALKPPGAECQWAYRRSHFGYKVLARQLSKRKRCIAHQLSLLTGQDKVPRHICIRNIQKMDITRINRVPD